MNNIKNLSAVSLPNASYVSSLKESGYTITSFQDTTWGLCFNTNDSLMKESTIRKAFIQTLNSRIAHAIYPVRMHTGQ